MNTILVCLSSLAVLVGIFLLQGLHHVDEGSIGVYFRGGALIDRVTEPGFHFHIPVYEKYEQVLVVVQTDSVENIACGTSGGVVLTFSRIEVVNRLKKRLAHETIKNYSASYDKTWIYDKVHHEINQLCSRHTLQEVYIDLFHTIDDKLKEALQNDCNHWAPGIEIIAVRITKPRIPVSIAENYEKMESEKTKLLIAAENQKYVEKMAETERRRMTIEAEGAAAVSRISVERQLAEKEGARNVAAIEDSMHLARQHALADAEAYARVKQAETNAAMLSPQFLALRAIEVLAPTTKVYFGPSIPTTFVDVGQLLTAFNASSVAMAAKEEEDRRGT